MLTTTQTPLSADATQSAGKYSFIVLLLMAFVARLAFALTLDPQHLYWPDEKLYDGIAQGLASGHGFVAPGYWSTPLWPMILAGVYKVFGHNLIAARVLGVLIGTAACAVTGATARRLFGPRVAWWTVLVMALYPPLVYLAGVLYSENIFSLMLAIVMYALVRFSERPGAGMALAVGASLAITALSRCVALSLVPMAALVPVVMTSLPWWKRIKLILLMWVAAAVLIAPWTIRNWKVFHSFVPISMGFGRTLWRGNNPTSCGDADDRYLGPIGEDLWRKRASDPAVRESIEQLLRRIISMPEADGDREQGREAVKYILENPGRCLGLYANKLLTLHCAFSRTRQSFEHTSLRNKIVAAATTYPVILIGIVGLIVYARRWRSLFPLYLVWGTFTFSLPVLTACTRFRLPTDPILITFAVAVTIELYARFTLTRSVETFKGSAADRVSLDLK